MTLVIIVLLIICLIWLLVISLVLWRAFGQYKQLTHDIDKKDFASILSQLKKQSQSTQKHLSLLDSETAQIQDQIKSHIQKVGFVRYNPFGNTGGDQSFCLTLLDHNNNGILITSLHTRDSTRLYTKEIKAGESADKITLSKEETQAITNAQHWRQS